LVKLNGPERSPFTTWLSRGGRLSPCVTPHTFLMGKSCTGEGMEKNWSVGRLLKKWTIPNRIQYYNLFNLSSLTWLPITSQSWRMRISCNWPQSSGFSSDLSSQSYSPSHRQCSGTHGPESHRNPAQVVIASATHDNLPSSPWKVVRNVFSRVSIRKSNLKQICDPNFSSLAQLLGPKTDHKTSRQTRPCSRCRHRTAIFLRCIPRNRRGTLCRRIYLKHATLKIPSLSFWETLNGSRGSPHGKNSSGR